MLQSAMIPKAKGKRGQGIARHYSGRLKGYELLLLGMAALAGGGVNAVAGGGTLITFLVLTVLGVPALAANITNTVALCPGYLSGTFAQSADLSGKGVRLWPLALVGVLGGAAGGVLLLETGEQTFRRLVPYLILLAAFLLAIQGAVRARLSRGKNGVTAKNGGGRGITESPRRGSLDLRGLFRRGSRRDAPRRPRARAPRITHAPERVQAVCLLFCQYCCSHLLSLLG